MKNITQAEIEKLIKHKYIKNTNKGYISTETDYQCGFYRTRNKRYIEDKYVDLAKKLE